MKICFLASGGGGNLKFLHLASELKYVHNLELTVIADRACDSIDYAKRHNIYAKVIHYQQDKNQNLLDELEYIHPDIIITNWHKIIDKKTVSLYRGKLINLHYSLLPAFGGLIGMAPVEEAYKQNCQFIGTTCHYINEGVDSGSIIAQAIVKTHLPIADAISDVFKKGCLTLLNSILIVSNENIIDKFNNPKYDFSPSLHFNDTPFNNNFWERLSKL